MVPNVTCASTCCHMVTCASTCCHMVTCKGATRHACDARVGMLEGCISFNLVFDFMFKSAFIFIP